MPCSSDAVLRLDKQFPDLARKPHAEYVPRLFAAINERWNDTPKGEIERFPASAQCCPSRSATAAKSHRLPSGAAISSPSCRRPRP